MTISNKQNDTKTDAEVMRAKLNVAGFLLTCGRGQESADMISQAIDILDLIIAEEAALSNKELEKN
tara:strand:- start:141 stop:338 length:198 start_codon:yes stop_codon:yes gene_type:complete